MDVARPKARFLFTCRNLPIALLATSLITGCATPGLPRPPSLNLPAPPSDLSAIRSGDVVTLRFTVPNSSTDKLPLRGSLTAIFCRSTFGQPCSPISSFRHPLPPIADSTGHLTYTWADNLPPDLATGTPRLLAYSVQVLNTSNRSAAYSSPAYTAAGTAPAPVTGLHTEGSRLGTILRWDAAAPLSASIQFQREDLGHHSSTPHPGPSIVQLATPPNTTPTTLLDTTTQPGEPYRYIATRHLTLNLAGHSIEFRSAPSTAVDFTLLPVYPPPAPTGLVAAAYTTDTKTFAVDLIWQPIDDAGLISPLAGYVVYRQALDTPSASPGTRLTPTAVALPAFHDTTAIPLTHYRYSVSAIDAGGNESPAITFTLDPAPAP